MTRYHQRYLISMLMKIVDLNLHISGIDNNGINVCSILYADDLVVFSASEAKLQCLLDTVYNWCKKWKMQTNENKSKILHLRNVGKRVTDFTFKNSPIFLELYLVINT